jgi:tRNA(Ile)-lysidine synthase
LRDRLPLLYWNSELVAVADLWICAGYGAPEGEGGLRFTWRPEG